MAASARAIAAEVRRRLPDVGEVKLHKLLYYAQGHHLAAFGVPLFGEIISAWDLGPVVGTLHHAEHHGISWPDSVELHEAELNTVGYVVGRYGRMTGSDLVRLTHTEPPWVEADSQRAAGTSVRIPNDRIRDYFLSVRDEADAEPLDHELLARMLEGAADQLAQPAHSDSLDDVRRRQQPLIG